MKFTAEPEKTRFDFYFADDIVDALAAVAKQAENQKLDHATADVVLALFAKRFHLTVSPV